MGNFWGSIHLRTDQREQVQRELERLAVEQKLRFYLGPVIKDWIAVYPHDNGQDTRVGDEIARATGFDAFHLILHDDDVFAYNFYRGGKLVDDYVSRPGYFSERDRAHEEALVGNPAAYADLLSRPVLEVKSILARSAGGMFEEMERIEKFAKALGLSNVQTAYEYLEEGESEGVKFRRQFIHVPDKAPERLEARRQGVAVREEKKRLKEQGILLAEYVVPKDGWARLCPDAAGGGILVDIAAFSFATGSASANPVVRAAAPWQKEPETLDFLPAEPIGALAMDRSGELLALVMGVHPHVGTEIWDLPRREQRARIAAVGLHLNFSADGEYLLVTSQEQAQVISTASGEVLRTIRTRGAQRGIFHPSGSAVLIDVQTSLLLVEMRGGQERPIYLGGKSHLPGLMGTLIRRQFAQFDPEKFEAQFRQQMESTIAKMTEMARRGGRKGLGAGVEVSGQEFAQQMREQMEKQIVEMKRGMEKARSGGAVMDHQSVERVTDIRFSSDGRLVLCATGNGLRVYEWKGFESGADEVRKPVHAFAATMRRPEDGVEIPAAILAVCEDVKRNRLLFGGMDGVMYSMDLADGSVRSFMQMPDRAAIVMMEMSGDGDAVGCWCRDLMNPRKRAGTSVYVWNAGRIH